MSEVIYLLPFLIALALFILDLCEVSLSPGPSDRAVAFPRASADHLARLRDAHALGPRARR